MEIPPFNEKDYKHAFIEESSFDIQYPLSRNEYIKKHLSTIISTANSYKVSVEFNEEYRTITVKTNNTTRDPYVIIKARDFVKLIARGMSVTNSKLIFKENFFCELISLNLGHKKSVLEKRIHRLEGDLLDCLAMLTNCKIVLHNYFVCCIGPYLGTQEVRQIVLDAIKNKHPAYNVKILMEKKKLERKEDMKTEDWKRYLPEIKKTHVRGRSRKHREKEN